ncbi:MAG: type IX secretion system sortase PorU [Bacteroidales bacterium]|nr:type IX secretion system sortase PorU [Bacteroidales bacterium]
MYRKYGFLFLITLLPFISFGGRECKSTSVLASGSWYKLAVLQTGIHKITYTDLVSLGIDVATVNPSHIRLFGNGGGMLPEANAQERIDDLRENSILVEDGGDGHFDPADYILFYGESPDKWLFDFTTRLFNHQKNLYSDTTFYFLNLSDGPGLRVQIKEPSSRIPNYFATTFNDYALHEEDQRNFIRSGKEWYGEEFNNATPIRDFSFSFPHIDTLSPLRLKSAVAAKAPNQSYFVIIANGRRFDSLKVDLTTSDEASYAKLKTRQSVLAFPKADQTITLQYKLPVSNALGWLNYLEINCVRKLIWTAPQMPFRSVNGFGTDMTTLFYLQKATPQTIVWDVTNPSAIGAVHTSLSDSLMTFKLATDTLRKFIAFDGSYFYPVICKGMIPNQNLHATPSSDMIIITHPDFLSQATQLAAFHQQHNDISVQVVTTKDIFNEFGGGGPDVTSIRDFIKFLYDKADSASKPRYVLLIGDGSYDPKNRIPGNNSFLPTFQSTESLSETGSYVTDDYFGIMEDTSGLEANGTINIGIGRFPVSDTATAQIMVNKIIHYSDKIYPVTADWKNTITFVADDENQNLHFHQAEDLAKIVGAQYPLFNVNKIYFDAYQLVQIPGGYRFPDATKALNSAIDKGSLIVNYTGHGSEAGWSYEQALTVTDIEQWSNADKLPVFFTATCEFSRFDNPERYTAGEKVILHPNGGAVALFSTTRKAYAGHNIKLNTSFFQHLMDKDASGSYLRMGDLIKLSKNLNGNIGLLRNFVLLGDPAQNIAFAGYNIKTVSINDEAVNQPDTVLGLSTVTVKGIIEDAMGQKVSGFNGTLTSAVFDKPVTYSTLGNIPNDTYPEPFTVQNSLLFKGDVPVHAGEFTFSCIVPKGISLQYGKGKLSYYAYNDQMDAAGYSDQIVIGGTDPSVDPENSGPAIALYMDNRDFVSGNRTGTDPVILADIFDTNGVNCFGLGIGHEIEAVLDHDRAHAVVLNDYFTPVFNSYTRGTVSYPLSDLTDGTHYLSLKAWDMFNNSSETGISFYVFPQNSISVKQVMNMPNPLIDHTWFVFQPEKKVSGGLDIQIRIYDITGRPVYSISGNWEEVGSGSPGMAKFFWNGTDYNGKKLSTGIYPYQVTFTGENGAYEKISQKLVIIR